MSQIPPPANNWNAGFAPPRQGPGWVVPMLIGGLIFAVGCGSGLLVGWGAGLATNFDDLLDYAPADTLISFEVPDTVVAGEPFVITVTLTETVGEIRTIDSIDVANADAIGIVFDSASPAPAYYDDTYGYLEMGHDLTIDPHATQQHEISLVCDQPGTHTVAVQVYFTETMYAEQSFTLTVEPGDQSSDPDF
ncbi:MAG: hypothetical protein ACI89L_001633 [Phycisphaerales bacterium]|jgi:hypothetical protein